MRSLFAILFLLLIPWSAYYMTRKHGPSFGLFYLFLFFATSRRGYILYHYNGILFVDLFAISILVLLLAKSRSFRLSSSGLVPLLVVFTAIAFLGAYKCHLDKAKLPFSNFYDLCTNNAIAETSKFVRALLILVVTENFVYWKKNITGIVDSIRLVYVFHALIALHQWRLGPVGLSMLGEYQIWSYRAYGLFEHPNFLADCLILVMPLFVRIFYLSRSRANITKNGIVAGMVLMALFVTFSRGAWIGLILALAGMFAYDVLTGTSRKFQKTSLVLTIAFASAFLIRYAPKIQERFVEDLRAEKGSAAKIRLPLMKVAWNMIKGNPVLGVGLGNYKLRSPEYIGGITGYSREALTQITHNSYLLLAAEAGIPGAIIYLSAIFLVLSKAFRVGVRGTLPALRHVAFGIFWGMTALLIALNTGPDFMIHEVLDTFWLMAGVVVGLSRLDKYVRAAARKRRYFEQVYAARPQVAHANESGETNR